MFPFKKYLPLFHICFKIFIEQRRRKGGKKMTQMMIQQFSSKFWWTSNFKCLYKRKIYALILKVSSFTLNIILYIDILSICFLTMLILYFAMQKYLIFTRGVSGFCPLWLLDHVSYLGRPFSPEVIQIVF